VSFWIIVEKLGLLNCSVHSPIVHKGSEAGSQAVPQVLQSVQPGSSPVLAAAGPVHVSVSFVRSSSFYHYEDENLIIIFVNNRSTKPVLASTIL
jgi:hypothetical protein